jgi:hypothetical protein
MVATFGWVEYLSNATDTATPTNLNLGSTLAANLAPSTYPITAGTYSYEKWVKANFSGSFTRIDNVQFWKSAGAYVTGEVINWTGQETAFNQPTESASADATTTVPVADPGTANVSIGGALAGSLTATGNSDFIILQATVTTAASAGAVNQKTFTLQYDEV